MNSRKLLILMALIVILLVFSFIFVALWGDYLADRNLEKRVYSDVIAAKLTLTNVNYTLYGSGTYTFSVEDTSPIEELYNISNFLPIFLRRYNVSLLDDSGDNYIFRIIITYGVYWRCQNITFSQFDLQLTFKTLTTSVLTSGYAFEDPFGPNGGLYRFYVWNQYAIKF